MQVGLGISTGVLSSTLVFLLCSIACSKAQTNSITFTNRQGAVYQNVRIVRISDDRLIYRENEGVGGGSIKLVDLPDGFLRQLGYDSAQVANNDLEKAIAAGMFRRVEGVVYDLRKKQSDWPTFQDVKLVQKLSENEVLIDPQPDRISIEALHVRHLAVFSDTERFTFRAKLVGTYSYINKKDNERLVRSYDAGRLCGRDEIPERMLKEGLASMQVELPPPSVSLSDILPDSEADKLRATGTGFFITDDGYFTNEHVVSHAKRIRIRSRIGVLEAQLVKASRLFDLAVLKIEGSFKALPLDFDRRMALGDSVFTIGFPNVDIQGAAPNYTDGKVSSLSGAEDDPSQYQISVPVQPGNSGGSLVAETGCVVGIVRAKLNDLTALASSGSVPQNVNYAVKVKYLRDLLETISGVAGRIKPPSGNVKVRESVKAAEDATVIVLVY
jgi:S1-C subfamily serine protease